MQKYKINTIKVRLFLLVFMCGGMYTSLPGQSFVSSEDAYVRGGSYADDNYGGDVELFIKQGSKSDFYRKSYLKFELKDKNLTAVKIEKATLRIYATSASACPVTALACEDNWTENEITWNNAPAFIKELATSNVSTSGRYYDWDITGYVQEEIVSDSIVSVAIYDLNASNETLRFSSSEASSNKPYLLIETSNLTAPAAPSDLRLESSSNESISLIWNDNANSELGFKIERKSGTEAFRVIDSVGVNETNYVDFAVQTSASYTYRINAYNAVGISDYSNSVTVIAEDINYYIDALNGNDSNDGLSEETAWKSLEKVNASTFKAGNRILFKAGDVWTGQLYPKGSGNEGGSIIIDMYGEGNKPIIDGNGMEGTGVVYLYNQEYWEINNLEIINDADEAGDRRGVRIEAENFGTAHHIHLKNLHIHNIRGSVGQDRSDKRTSGIGFGIIDAAISTHFDDILVEGCLIHDCENQGIITEYVKNGGFYPGTDEWENVKITNAAIRNNTIHGISKNAIIVRLWEGGVVENNVCYNTANGITGNTIFSAACDGTIFQFNEGYDNNSPDYDGSLYDADLRSPRTIWQYSYSHDNAHGLFITCTVQEDEDVICRYNISQNDKGRIFCMNYPNASCYNYNNTIYVGKGLSPEIISERNKGGSGTRNYTFVNNIVYNMGSATYDFETEGYTRYINNNCFYGNHDASEPYDANKKISDPKFVNPGMGGIGLNTVDGYQLQANSPCIDAGKTIENNGGFDYWGNPLIDGATDIGAHEYVRPSSNLQPSKEDMVQELYLYPNPLNQDKLLVSLPGFDLGDGELRIVNLKGQLVHRETIQQKNQLEIDAGSVLRSGIYVIEVQLPDRMLNARLVVQ